MKRSLLFIGLVVALLPSFVRAQETARTYSYNCYVEDDQDGDRTVVRKEGVLTTNDPKTFFKQSFEVKGSKNKLFFALGYQNEDHYISLSIGDETKNIRAETADNDPKRLYVYLGTTDVSVYTGCDFAAQKRP